MRCKTFDCYESQKFKSEIRNSNVKHLIAMNHRNSNLFNIRVKCDNLVNSTSQKSESQSCSDASIIG